MQSPAFKRALSATGYMSSNGDAAPGLVLAGTGTTFRLKPILADKRVGLNADGVFSAQNVPTAIFKDAGNAVPTDDEISRWHELAWNIGVAPLLWIITPTDIRIFDCYSSPTNEANTQRASIPLDTFNLNAEEQLKSLDSMCGRYATETGSFWSSRIGKRIDRCHRVDRELLSEISALEDMLTETPPVDPQANSQEGGEKKAAREFAQRLIGRCIFTLYLVDRGIAQQFLPPNFPVDVAKMFSSVESAFRLFTWLRNTFNGDLFPMDNPGAEHQRLGEDHLELLRRFANGFSLISGQGRLFRFRYEAIPIDLISSIYQQFARTSAAANAHEQGLHYTPIELVHFTLDPVFEQLNSAARVIDPTCGSGAFLVEAFRRLVWKNAEGGIANRALVRRVLYTQLFGIDINRSALGIAAFSLYLAALELDEEPVSNISDLKFDRLIGTTLFEANTIRDELPGTITEKAFDAVVGNPPWTFVGQSTTKPRNGKGSEISTRPRRSPDQEFLWVASRLAGEQGRIGMIMKSSPFFSRDSHAIDARNSLLEKLAPSALINLSALRKDGLFPGAAGPALIFFARCALVQRADRLLVGSVPWTKDFKRNGVFSVGPGDFRTLPLSRVKRTPATLKAAIFGTSRDVWLIEKLEHSFPTLENFLKIEGINSRGQGFQIAGNGGYTPPPEYFNLKVLTPHDYTPFRISLPLLEPFRHEVLHRIREPQIFKGPLLICPKGAHTRAVEAGRYSATFSKSGVLYTESFYGISFAGQDSTIARLLLAVLNSSVASFQLAFAGGSWGSERPTVEPFNLTSIRIPDFKKCSQRQIRAVLAAEKSLAHDQENSTKIAELDDAVFSLYGLERDEIILARESVGRARMMLFEGTKDRTAFTELPSISSLQVYASEVVRVVNSYLRARNARHLEAFVYFPGSKKAAPNEVIPGLTAVKFAMKQGGPTDEPIVNIGSEADMDILDRLLRGQGNNYIPPYLNERRQLRIYGINDLLIIKPSEVRSWTRTAGLNDADLILADHWMKEAHESTK